MNRPIIVATLLVALASIISVSHAATEEYSAKLIILETFFGDGNEKRNKKLYSGKRQPDAGLAQILVLPGISITAVDDRRVRSWKWIRHGGYRGYKQLPGTYEFEVTSWKRKISGTHKNTLGTMGKTKKDTTYTLKAVLEAGQKYVLSPIWNDGEMGIIAPSQVCLQGPSDSERYCALRPPESDDVFTMDEKHGVIVIGMARSIPTKIILINLECEWRSLDKEPVVRGDKAATKLRDICKLVFEATDSKGYIVESVDAGVWMWWGVWYYAVLKNAAATPLIATITFDVEPGKVNYIGHVGAATFSKKDVSGDWWAGEPDADVIKGKVLGFGVVDRFSELEPIIRAGFGDSEIVNKATHYAGLFGDAETEKKATD